MILTAEGACASPEFLRSVEDALAGSDGAATSLWTGRGATALYWGLRATAAARVVSGLPEVILPAIGCTALADAARLAGWRPRFADVAHDGMVTPDTVRLRLNSRTRAVVLIHLFGQTGDPAPLATWCRHHDLLLIEDAAQALGARLPGGQAVGSAGHMVFYSFNRSKILGCGGGLLLVKHEELGRSLEMLLRCESAVAGPEAPLLAQSERNLHHGLCALLRLGLTEDVSDIYLRLRKAYGALWLRPLDQPEAVRDAWKGLEAHLAERMRKARIYDELLQEGPWRCLDGWRDSGVCWRYSLLLDEPRRTVDVSEAVRADGFHVSNLYWPMNQLLLPEDLCPVADDFARRVINLWVDPEVDDDWVRRCARSLLRQAQTQLMGVGPLARWPVDPLAR